jgi:hemin uptake protein HemP
MLSRTIITKTGCAGNTPRGSHELFGVGNPPERQVSHHGVASIRCPIKYLRVWSGSSAITRILLNWLDRTNENRYRSLQMETGQKTAQPESSRHEPALRRVTSEQLLAPAGELVILHQGREYRLRVTQNGKLILTA